MNNLPQSSYDRLKAACQDILLTKHVNPDCYTEYEPIPDDEFWVEVTLPISGRIVRNVPADW
jgi:hypothetical protein